MKKLSPKKTRALNALIEENTIKDAAQAIGIGETTIFRYLQDEDFQKAYRSAKRRIVEHTITRLQNATTEAVDTLLSIMKDNNIPASPRVTAARTIINTAIKAVEIEDMLVRLEEIERHLGLGR